MTKKISNRIQELTALREAFILELARLCEQYEKRILEVTAPEK